MKNLESYKGFQYNLFEEFVGISDYKDWIKHANLDFYKQIGEYFKKFTDHDKNFNRIYFDLEMYHEFEVKIPQELRDFMSWNIYPIVDYEKGICSDKDGREIKIGKLLKKLGEERLLKVYSDSKKNTLKNKKNLQVVISRHPYDIIGMSTNRGWTTCHDIHDKRYGGEHLINLKHILRSGCLIAYLIKKTDRNIELPISRCLINYQRYSRVNPLYVDEHVYGTNVPEFRNFLLKWTKEYNFHMDGKD